MCPLSFRVYKMDTICCQLLYLCYENAFFYLCIAMHVRITYCEVCTKQTLREMNVVPITIHLKLVLTYRTLYTL